MKRPLSHVCAIFVYVMYIGLTVMKLAHGRNDPMADILSVVCVAQLLGALAAPRDRRQFWVGSVVLWMIVLGMLFDTVVQPGMLLYHHAPEVHATWATVAVNAVVVAALCILPCAYAFGEKSREFFGLAPRRKK